MSFTMTNRSLIRFEDTKKDGEWERTLMFFNVGISGRVCYDRRNEIMAPRTSDFSGKRRNPGGGLSNPITESAMSFGAPNEFYATSHDFPDGFDYRNYRPRAFRQRRDNSSFSKSRRHVQYRMIKPGRVRMDIGSVSPSPSLDSVGYYGNYKKYNRISDSENAREYEPYFPDESLELEDYEPDNRMAQYPKYTEETKVPRTYQNLQPFNAPRYESPYEHSFYASRPTQQNFQVPRVRQPYGRYYHYTEDPPQYELSRNYRDNQPADPPLSTYRRNRIYRQASGSLPPHYDQNYYTHDPEEYDNNFDYNEPAQYYEERPAEYRDPQNNDLPDYYEQIRKTPPPTPFPKPQPRYKRYAKSSFENKDITSRSHCPTISYHTESELKKPEAHQNKYVGCKKYYQPIKFRPRKGCNHFKETKEVPIKYRRISEDLLRLAPPKKYEQNIEDATNRFSIENNLEKIYKLHRTAEKSTPNSFKKYFKEDFSRRNKNENKINLDESFRESQNRMSLPDRQKPVDFEGVKEFNIGSEIPHRIHKKIQTPSSIFFTIEIPYKKKERSRSLPRKSEYLPKRSDSGCETFAPSLRSAINPVPYLGYNFLTQKTLKPQSPICEVGKNRKRKTMRQKISGFFRRSKMRLSRTNIFRNKSKVVDNCKPGHRSPNCDCSNGIPDSGLSSPKFAPSNHSLQELKKKFPSVEITCQRCCSKKKRECHYPTVYRGKCNQLFENNNELYHEYSMFNVLSSTNHRSKVNNDQYDHFDRELGKQTSQYFRPSLHPKSSCAKEFDRVSSGNCSGNKSGNSTEESEINLRLTIHATDVSLTGSPRIISSKIVKEKPLWKNNTQIVKSDSNEDSQISILRAPNLSVSRNASGSSTCESQGSQFKNVRFPQLPSAHNSSSSISNSSKSCASNASQDIVSRKSPNSFKNCASSNQKTQTSQGDSSNRKSIEACSKPPENPQKRSVENLCPRHRINTNWTVTHKSNTSQSQPDPGFSWSPDKLEMNSSRPSRPGLSLPNTIEMCSRPQSDQNDVIKKSSLKGVNNCQEKATPKKVVLKTNSSKSLLSGSVSGSCQSNKSVSSGENQDMDNIRKNECHRSQSHDFQFDDDRKQEVPPRRSCSWPRQSPRSISAVPKRKSSLEFRTKSNFAPNNSKKTSDSKTTKCSCCSLKNNNTVSTNQSAKNMQLACCAGPNQTPALPKDVLQDSTNSSIRGDLSCPNPMTDWENVSSCRRSFVEELKRELLKSFRTEQQIESQGPFLRPTPHIMIFPCVPGPMNQSNSTPNPNLFRRPDSVICWTPCSKPQIPF